MTKFEDGPAKGRYLSLKRAPRFLRVVLDPHGGGKWDALDQLDDAPTASETIYAYEIHGEPIRGFVTKRGGGGGYFEGGNYRIVAEQPTEEEMRDTAKWRAWCQRKAEAGL